MEETIDLRPYVEALLRRWWVILGAVIAGVLIAVFLNYSQTNYRATALVAVTDPAQRLQFDTRIINTLDLGTLLQAYPELATSDEVLTILLDRAAELSNGSIASIAQLRDMLSANKGADPRLVRLSVRNEDPQLTADLANAWADTFVTFVNAIYQAQGGDVEFFNDQLAETDAQLRAAERELVDFQSGSRMGIVDNQLQSLSTLQASYLAEQRRLKLAIDDIRALRDQIEAGEGDTITWGDQLAALSLQLKVYETASATPETGSALQLQLNSQEDLTTSQRAEQLSLLDDLAGAAERSLDELDVKLLGLEPSIFELQREKQDLFNQYEALTRDRDIAKETYVTLARKIDEVRIQAEDTDSGVRVISLAAPPIKPERSNVIFSAAAAGLAAFLLSAAVIILLAWWKGFDQRSAAQ